MVEESSQRTFTAEEASSVIILGGSTYPTHAEDSAMVIGTRTAELELGEFPNTELGMVIGESVRGKKVFIIQTDVDECHGGLGPTSWSVNDSLVQTALLVDTANRASADEVTVIKPHFAYARQDRKKHGREPISALAHIDMLAAVGMKRLLAVDAHSQQALSHNPLFDNLSAVDDLQIATKGYFEDEDIDPEDVIFIAPDGGSLSLPEHFADHLGGRISVMAKTRDREGGVKHAQRIENVGGRTCVLVDDMIDTAGTIKSAVQILRRSGAERVVVAATHGLFSGPALERLTEAEIDKIIVSDTVPQKNSGQAFGERLQVVQVAPLIGKAIYEIATNGSVSSIFPDGKGFRR